MANLDHLALLNQSIQKWNRWRTANPSIKVDLSEANLSEVNLIGANLSDANLNRADLLAANLLKADLSRADLSETNLCEINLSEANLTGASLYKAFLVDANLREANLSQTTLFGAGFIGANLSGAHLIRADLIGAVFNGAQVDGVNFNKSMLMDTVFSDVNLAEAKNLDACHHEGPSIVDFRTLQKSGPLPLPFLRGCGLPDLLINFLPSLINQPIQYYSCFISYSSKDEDFAKRLNADLQSEGVRCWFAPEDIKGGRKIHEQIGEAIRLHEKLLLVLSEHSMKSDWVKTEIAKARQRETREDRQVLFPIRLVDFDTIQQWECFDADTGKDSAREIREIYIPDFSNWKNHADYQHAFNRLLRDLKQELERKPVE